MLIAAYALQVRHAFVYIRGEFVKQILPVAAKSLNLTAVILFLVGSVGVFMAASLPLLPAAQRRRATRVRQ